MKSYESDYRGARFFKCDLQMQTPVDAAHWRGSPMGTDDAGMRAAALEYAGRCYEVGLEVVGITDHNFASREFIRFLRQAFSDAVPAGRAPIVMFPGFEIQADVGMGLHVLALFEPEADLEQLDHLVTECGVTMPRFGAGGARKSTKRLPEILKVVQKRDAGGALRGIVICPHSQADAGIFDNDRIAEWLQQEEFTNPDLLCIEVPRPPSGMSLGWQRLLRSGADCDPGWSRRRPIACIMSSDAKALYPTEEQPNSIGYRHSWIKMSRPSIEALRQAFLDHESRIRLGAARPEDSYQYPWIRRVSVQGMRFVGDLDVALSPNLNTIIGGRGTGKSSLVEYLRISLAQEASIRGDEPKKNLEKLRATVSDVARIGVNIEREAAHWKLVSVGRAKPDVAEGQPIADLTTLFPIRILSQREVYSIAEDNDARNALVDDPIQARLDELGREESDLRARIDDLNRRIAMLPDLRARRQTLEAELQDRALRLSTLRSLEQPLARWRGVLAEQRVVEALEEHLRAVLASASSVEGLALLRAPELLQQLDGTPNYQALAELTTHLAELMLALSEDIKESLRQFERDASSALSAGAVVAWRASLAVERSDYETLRDKLVAEGTDPDRFIQYEDEARERIASIAALDADIHAVEELRMQRDGPEASGGLIESLHRNWRAAADERRQAAVALTDMVPKTSTGRPFVEAIVHTLGDHVAFHSLMKAEIRDGRRITAQDWDSFVASVLPAASESSLPPGEMVARWMHEYHEQRTPSGSPIRAGAREASVLLEWLTDDRIQALRLARTPDRIEVNLYRQDGSHVGELAGPELSVGQRCTAVLALLLAQDSRPIVIDQPEEDLDNEFVYQELVPLLRRIKERRQVIVVSHNANIPVNADSELVVALEVRDQRGRPKETPELGIAIGALDKEAVKQAVEMIMEGSEEAFRRRQEKYGF